MIEAISQKLNLYHVVFQLCFFDVKQMLPSCWVSFGVLKVILKHLDCCDFENIFKVPKAQLNELFHISGWKLILKNKQKISGYDKITKNETISG